MYSNRLIATWFKCHLVAINLSGIYHNYQLHDFANPSLYTANTVNIIPLPPWSSFL